MRITLALLAAVCLAGCSARAIDLNGAVDELDRAVWTDGLKPISAADKPKLPPLK
jgi:hypothetical protein